MADPAGTKLYSPQLLALSASLANYPLDSAFSRRAEARSRTCGSTIIAGLDTDDDQRVSRIGMQVSACAVGQSSAAIMAGDIRGRSERDLRNMLSDIEAWLEDAGATPDWPGFEALVPAKPHTGRHGALLLPWKAALAALSSDDPSG
ncbi:iron-sulfur cluster assembly scaffold protein [Erythrobacter rubeus]|uniref:Iron-sulfur cluster assembly scaffold protein n=1 Tax=Erythrobacter rubeus TaxID=2760803 RepID=A0ABR8KMK0_9SPHN|nr:iron-sulfur cluster assembly scaffold protein [Erythrobacter rubeus]MBD2841793.1 iron-sulfur cluster assembly scaffold protein [Erythrobacter rubeus]